MTTYYLLEKLRKIKGLEHAKYVDPYAVRLALGMPLLILPSSIAIGDIIAYENEKSKSREGRKQRYTFAGAGYFKRMQEKSLYTMDMKEINDRISKLNLNGIFNIRLC